MNQLQNISVRLVLILRGLSLASLEREEGQSLVEYALILVVIAVAVVASLTFLRDEIDSAFSVIGSTL